MKRKSTPEKPKRGAPTLFFVPMRSVLVKLDPASIKRAKKLGEGNVSAGIRRALAASLRIQSPAAVEKSGGT